MILRWDYPGLSRWTLNDITRERVKEHFYKGVAKGIQKDTQSKQLREDGGRSWSNRVTSPWMLGQPPEAGRGEEWILPQGHLGRKEALPDLGLLASRTLRKLISVIWGTHCVVFYYSSPSKLVHSEKLFWIKIQKIQDGWCGGALWSSSMNG